MENRELSADDPNQRVTYPQELWGAARPPPTQVFCPRHLARHPSWAYLPKIPTAAPCAECVAETGGIAAGDPA